MDSASANNGGLFGCAGGDNYRGVLIKDGERVEIRSRKNRDLTGMYPGVVEARLAVDAEAAVVPGERSGAWQKPKLELSQEFVVGGYRPGFNSVDAPLVGYYEGRRLHFAGKVKAGFVAHTRRELFRELERLRTAACPFSDLPNSRSDRWGGGVTADEMRAMQWVRPDVVVQVRFVEWTAEGRLRHAALVGLRPDKEAKEVRRE